MTCPVRHWNTGPFVGVNLQSVHLKILTIPSIQNWAPWFSTCLSSFWIRLMFSWWKVRICGSRTMRQMGHVFNLEKQALHPKCPFRHWIKAEGSDLFQHTGHSNSCSNFSSGKQFFFCLLLLLILLFTLVSVDFSAIASAFKNHTLEKNYEILFNFICIIALIRHRVKSMSSKFWRSWELLTNKLLELIKERINKRENKLQRWIRISATRISTQLCTRKKIFFSFLIFCCFIIHEIFKQNSLMITI